MRIPDPHGYEMEVICGMQQITRAAGRRNVLNWGEQKLRRAGELMRLRAASQVKRMGHGVLMTTKPAEATKWFRETLGFVPSDDVYAGTKDNIIASFNRCDRGDIFVDHHVFLCLAGSKTGLNHMLAYEVQSIDDVMLRQRLRDMKKYGTSGIGRHLLGSQVFDYWKDPWGRVHEHWTDTDVLDVSAPPSLLPAEEGLDSQWGEPAQAFIEHAVP